MNAIRKKLFELTSEEIEQISSFLESNFCTVFHEPDFNRIVSETFNSQFSYNLVYNDDGGLIALCPLHSIKDSFLTNTYSNPAIYDIPYGGWIFNRNTVLLPDLMQQMQLSYNETLTYWSIPQINANDYSLIRNKKEYQTGIIDLTASLDEILQKCIFRKRRQSITKAARKGVVVEKLSLSNLDIFIEQHNFLRNSVGLRIHPSTFYTKLFEHYYTQNKIAAFVSKLGNNYLASGLIIGNLQITHLWVAGKPKDVSEIVPRQELLIWESIKWAKEHGSRYFDLCVVEPERLPHIARFKLGFSRNIVPFYFCVKKNLGYRMISRSRKILGLK